MRRAPLALLLGLAACSSKSPEPAPKADVDTTLLAFVVEDLLVHRDFKTYPAWNDRPKLVVSDRTRAALGFLSPAQLSGELNDAPAWGLDLAQDLAERNAVPVVIPASTFPNPRVVVLPEADFLAIVGRTQESRTDAFEGRFRDAKAYVLFWRPAVSADGKRAVVRFAFGPTPHGACGTYLLEKEAAGWIIRHRDFAYYV